MNSSDFFKTNNTTLNPTPVGRASAPLKVLVVEDNEIDQTMMARGLIENPDVCLVRAAFSGLKAMEFILVDGFRPDLILLDISMPGMDGIDLLGYLAEMSEIALTPIVMVSSSNRPEDIEITLETYASGYFVKPDRISELKATLNHIVECTVSGLPYQTAMPKSIN